MSRYWREIERNSNERATGFVKPLGLDDEGYPMVVGPVEGVLIGNFDEAAERMLGALGGLEGPMSDERTMATLLRAAVGGEE